MASPPSVTETNREIITQFYGMLAARNFAGVQALFDEDIEIHEPACLPYGGVYRGIAGAQKLFGKVPQYIDISTFRIEAIVADGDRVIGLFDGTILRTGVRVAIAEESLIRDGKIVRVRVFLFDPTLVTNVATAT